MATNKCNQFQEEVDEKILECTICLNKLRNPKSLNCLHSFCLHCLDDWVKKEEGKLTCPSCSKAYPIPEGGLQKLLPNTFLNNQLEIMELFAKRDRMKCVCGKEEQAKYYCQECRHYLCSTCSDHHKILPMTANHKLHSVEDVQTMTPQQFALLHPPPLCSVKNHNKPLEYYCTHCKILICMSCTVITDHKECKKISISDAFQEFKKTVTELKLRESANHSIDILIEGLKAVVDNDTKLEQNKETSLRDIDNLVQVLIEKIREKGDKMKNKVETIYKNKKEVNNMQMNNLKTTISDVKTKLSFLNQLLKSDEAAAVKSSDTVITALKDRIEELPKTEPNDNGQIYFFINTHQISSLQQCDIGNVTQTRTATNCLKLKAEEAVTQGQTIVVKVIKIDECEIEANQLKATWTQPTGENNITQVEEDNEDYVVKGKCTSPGVCRLDVSVDGEPINKSPMIIKVEKEGLVNTIEINEEMVTHVVKCEDDCLLVSCQTEYIVMYKQSGECIGKVTLPQGVKVNRMYKMKNLNGDIAFSDLGNKCITIIKLNGQVVKSIGQGLLKNPHGIHVDEASNVVYVADWDIGCMFMFDIDSGQITRRMKSGRMITDVTITKGGNVILLHHWSLSQNTGLHLFNNEGTLMKLLVKTGIGSGKVKLPRGVVVDEDDNIIISSEHKVQLFSSDGNFIKRIDKQEDGIKNPWGLSIISHHPRTIAVANQGNKTIKIFNY